VQGSESVSSERSAAPVGEPDGQDRGGKARLGPSAAALIVDDPRFEGHVPPGPHPERPERLVAARQAVAERTAAGTRFERVEPRPASDEELVRVHAPRFIESLANLRGETGYLDADTYVSAESVSIARLAAGSLVSMIDRMIDGPVRKGVALLRPPGHHARPARAMGFCLLNNVAIAAAHARARGLERIAIIDWDVHHGNGTQEIFWTDPNVLYVSTHQYPFYPGTGEADEVGDADGKGYTVNVPLAAGGGDAEYASAFERIVLPVVADYAPDLVLVSAGFDASARDPLAQMELSPNAFGWMAREVARTTAATTQGRMALVLEGGYDLVALEAGLRSAIDGMLSLHADDLRGNPDDEGIARAAEWAKKAWKSVG
jgi:acetoin utilization deacetylase AcuC-like enzyme